MRRRITGMITTMTVTAAMMLATVPAMAQEPVAECQPGPSNGATATSVSEWDLESLEQFAAFLANRYGVTKEEALARATITFDFCDKNLDGFVCLQTKQRTVEEVKYSGGWLVEDNNYQLGLS